MESENQTYNESEEEEDNSANEFLSNVPEKMRSYLLSKMLKTEIWFKKDFLQVTGSFKERGARYALLQLSKEQKKKGVIAASAGNHALALSYHGQSLNVPVTVVMPVTAPLMKISSCRQNGANVILQGNDLGNPKETAMKLSVEKGYVYINGYDHPDILAGQGSMAFEIDSQLPEIDAIILPIGGGSLLTGLGLAMKRLRPNVKIYGVESEACPSFAKALEAGKPTYIKPDPSTADGLAVPVVGYNSFHNSEHLITRHQLAAVSEESITLAILRLLECEKVVVEGAGAVGLAALLAGKFPELVGKVIVLTGANIDTTVLGRCLERGLGTDRRLVRFSVTISDRPGGLLELVALLTKIGVSIKDAYFFRGWTKTDVFSVTVKAAAETRDLDHAKELEKLLNTFYKDVVFSPPI